MKNQFKTFIEFAEEIDRREAVKMDLIVPATQMLMTGPDEIHIADSSFGINPVAHSQIADKLNIPKKYYDAMPQIKGLREHNVNAWLEKSQNNYLARTLDGNVRALMSDRYKPMDNYMVLQSFLPVLKENADFQILSDNLSETKMYLQIIFLNMEADVKAGDTIKWGIILSNSEVGHGSVNIETMTYRLICKNGMIGSSILKRNHIGSRIDIKEEDYNLYADDTIEADMHAFQLKMRDVLKDAVSEIAFRKEVETMQAAAKDIILKPETVVKNVTKHFNLNESLSESILSNMVQDGNMNRWGLANGITALAHNMKNADSQYEVEKIGKNVITLASDQWENLSA